MTVTKPPVVEILNLVMFERPRDQESAHTLATRRPFLLGRRDNVLVGGTGKEYFRQSLLVRTKEDQPQRSEDRSPTCDGQRHDYADLCQRMKFGLGAEFGSYPQNDGNILPAPLNRRGIERPSVGWPALLCPLPAGTEARPGDVRRRALVVAFQGYVKLHCHFGLLWTSSKKPSYPVKRENLYQRCCYICSRTGYFRPPSNSGSRWRIDADFFPSWGARSAVRTPNQL